MDLVTFVGAKCIIFDGYRKNLWLWKSLYTGLLGKLVASKIFNFVLMQKFVYKPIEILCYVEPLDLRFPFTHKINESDTSGMIKHK